MTSTLYEPGDIVRHTGRFLRSVGLVVGAPINGEVKAVRNAQNGQRLDVEWSDSTRSWVLAVNVEFCPRARALTERRRRDRGLR